MTSELIEQIKDRDYLYTKAKKSGCEDSWNIAKHLRNVTNANIRQAKRDFVLAELESCETDCKRFWYTIRSVIPSNKGDTRQEIMLKDKGKKLPKDKVAHHINDYFINIGKMGKTDNNTTPQPVMTTKDNVMGDTIQGCNITTSDEMTEPWSVDEFNVDEVLKIVKDINVSKSSGLQNVSSLIVKEAFTFLIAQVTYMFNLSLATSVFPKAWNEALVIPIPKTGNLTQVKNYRPISLLPIPGKLLEKLMHKQLSNFIEENSLISNFQHGFRKQHSTIHSVAQLTNFVNIKMDAKLPTLATFIDFRKAFDCVQHDVLLEKLSLLGLEAGVVSWFKSYLTDRKQRVLANNTHSSFLTVTQGVPQGSVLGPLFYILYADDIVGTIKHCKIALYADDTVLYTSNQDFVCFARYMKDDINALLNWCDTNGIKMNTDKTKIMLFGNPKWLEKLPEVAMHIDGSPIDRVNSYKYLGVELDSQLNYNRHVRKLLSGATLKLRQKITKDAVLSHCQICNTCL